MSFQNVNHIQRVRILYKTILKLHRGLPPELQIIGNDYTRDEFKRHKKCNEQEKNIFLNEWTNYAITLTKQLGIKGPKTAKPLGVALSEADLNKLRDEQVVQLYELRNAALAEEQQNETK